MLIVWLSVLLLVCLPPVFPKVETRIASLSEKTIQLQYSFSCTRTIYLEKSIEYKSQRLSRRSRFIILMPFLLTTFPRTHQPSSIHPTIFYQSATQDVIYLPILSTFPRPLISSLSNVASVAQPPCYLYWMAHPPTVLVLFEFSNCISFDLQCSSQENNMIDLRGKKKAS